MKLLRCLSLCLVTQFLCLGGIRAAQVDPAYQAAVDAYVDAAGGELRAIRVQADEVFKVIPEEKKNDVKDFFSKLEKCEETYDELKAATPKDFDKTKARYEQERSEVTKAWAKAAG